MRHAQSCLSLGLALMLASTGMSALASQSEVLDPHAPTLPLTHQTLAPSGKIVEQPGNWKAANQAVAEFPRGHADVIRWEAAQPTSTPQTQPSSPGHRQHSNHQHHHGGQP